MATWSVMADVPNPIIVDAAGTAGSGYVLKAYEPGGTTSTSIAIDSNGSSPQTSLTANSEGKWEVTGNEILPFIDRLHKWGIFANAADAAANTPFYMGPFDNVPATIASINTYSNLIAALDGPDVVGTFITIPERVSGTGFGGGRYEVVSSNPGFNRINPQKTDGSGNYLELVRDKPYILYEQAGAQGDFDINAANGDPASNVGTDDTAALQECSDYIENNFDAFDSNPSTTNISLRNFAGGGEARGRNGANYLVSGTTTYMPGVVHNLMGSSVSADTSATWTDVTGPIVGWIAVTEGGSGFTSVPDIALSGGGFSVVAQAVAVINNGAISHIWVTINGEGYASAPTVGISGGGGSGAAATAELGIIGQPLFETTVPVGTSLAWGGGPENGFVWGRNVADCVRYVKQKDGTSARLTAFEGKHTCFAFLGADRNEFVDFSAFSAGKYNIFLTGFWFGAGLLGSNENRFHGGDSLFGVRACIYSDNITSANVFNMTVRQSSGDSPKGSEIILGGNTIGQIIRDSKIEHDGANPEPVIVILNGQGHLLSYISGTNNSSVPYKWVHNVRGNNVAVDMTSASALMSQRVDGNLTDDISPFQSDAANGIAIIKVPYTTEPKLASMHSWCRDADGNVQGGSRFTGWIFNGGLSGRGSLTDEIELEGELSNSKCRQTYIKGDTQPRLIERADATIGLGSGTVAPADFGQIQTGVSASQADFEDETSTINTLGKFKYKIVGDDTTNTLLWANNPGVNAAWKKVTDNSVLYTPVTPP